MRWFGGLYPKLFLWFWLTLLVMIALVVTIPRLWSETYFELPDRPLRHMQGFVDEVERKVERRRRPPPGEGKRWYLVNADGESRDGSPVPEIVLSLQLASTADGKPRGVIDGRWLYAGPWDIRIHGQDWQIVLRHPKDKSPLPLLPFMFNHPWRLVVLIVLISGGLCGFLAWRLGRPLHQLRQTAQSLAEGNLEARPAYELLSRRDEVGLLSRQLSDMADALGSEIEAQQQLLRDVSHELRSPLTRLQLAIGLMRRSEGESDLLQRVERESLKLEEMIAELLQLARMQRKREGMVPLELSELLSQAVNDAQIEAESAGLKLSVNVSPEGAEAWCAGDASLLSRAIDNLIRNAVRFAKGRIEVNLQKHDGDIQISVADDGPGVPDHELAHIFRPFYRLDDARTPELDSGIGLGMAIVAAAVQAHHGDVVARRSEFGGLEVSMTLPAKAERLQ
ncbi:ATP-binding protein [Corallincola platygyrae]|uniref:histidine kinase n=1 Tax=Corallincola platygyrae TaxID=1193278 RepID=A0ABW4XR30_9GAMM